MRYIKEYNQFNNFIISNIQNSEIEEVLDICVNVFDAVDSPDEIKSYLREETDFNISLKATINNKIVGCYLFNTKSVNDFLKDCDCLKEDISKYENKRGIQGLALALLPEYRGSGIGKELRKMSINKNYDYIWGQHLKGLHNIDQWEKFGRRVIADGNIDGEEMYVTLMDI